MLLFIWPLSLVIHAPYTSTQLATWLTLFVCAAASYGTTDDLLRSLRRQTIDLFYHGFDNYMAHAFPEDELKPLICQPLTRDRHNPAHIELNDVLGNYSLTLIDSLSTLAILASSTDLSESTRDPLHDFQRGVVSLVELYGDGSPGPTGLGSRSRGFDLDSKVQVFETVIRGVGGLVSAHLFAVGELPIKRLKDPSKQPSAIHGPLPQPNPQSWQDDFRYDGQLLRLAEDLAKRLVPAFYTDSGLPYPRVNLRYGVPFYPNSPLNSDPEYGFCDKDDPGSREITETCSAGAGSLVLEFTTLSHLTGNPLYESLAKTAFWAVWDRRSTIDLIGAGIDAESGQWVNSYTGIGAGVDSFFEYALKSHVLLSGSPQSNSNHSDANDFLQVWLDGHASIKKHLYRGAPYYHPHYIQGDLYSGAPRGHWMDSLSAYYPGSLTLAGELEEAIEAHMLFAALWTRYAAIPERWSSAHGAIESDLRWWGGRPEFIESTWYLYQATKDPWYLFVAEMALKDIRRRCWTKCGWAGLEDVRTGELKDRMESFFLGETAKYLYLLFDPAHPLNKLDSAFVFSTEGHPLLLPKVQQEKSGSTQRTPPYNTPVQLSLLATCPTPAPPRPFTISNVVSRPNYFHAASLARLHQVPNFDDNQGFQPVESSYTPKIWRETLKKSPTNFTFYPWNLPPQYIPSNGQTLKLLTRVSFDLSFPSFPNAVPGALSLKHVEDGILVESISGLTLELVKESADLIDLGSTEVFRISQVAQVPLGKDQVVFVESEAVAGLSPADPYFTRHHDPGAIDLIVDSPEEPESVIDEPIDVLEPVLSAMPNLSLNLTKIPRADEKEHVGIFQLLFQQLSSAQNPLATLFQGTHFHEESTHPHRNYPTTRPLIAAGMATGVGAVPLPSIPGSTPSVQNSPLPWTKIYVLDDELCSQVMHTEIPQEYQIIVIRRGGCSFSEKLKNVPAFANTPSSLQLLIIVSYPRHEDGQTNTPLIRPHLDTEQLTPGGMKRVNGIPLVMIQGGEHAMNLLRDARAVGYRRRYRYESQGHRILNLELV